MPPAFHALSLDSQQPSWPGLLWGLELFTVCTMKGLDSIFDWAIR